MAGELDGLRMLTDQAVGEDSLGRGDGLGFDTYADVLSRVAVGTDGPFTIGVFGEWGTGKTSLLRLTKQRLDPRDEVTTVWFNAWQYEQEEHPIVPLVGTIIQAIERDGRFRDSLQDKGKALLRSLRAIAYGFSARTSVQVPGFATVEAGFVAKEMIDREEALSADPLIERSLHYRAFESLQAIELPAGARVVVFIDDLDRCFPDKAIRLLESIKLVLAQRGFIFVLGVARSVLEGYLDHRYREEYGLQQFRGASYLDKIVQLAFPIPPHAGRMEEFAGSVLADLHEDVADRLDETIRSVAEHLGGNPRSLVRFVNNVQIDAEIAAHVVEVEPRLEIFAVTRVLQARWRAFYDLVVLDDELAEHAAQLDERGRSTSTDVALADSREDVQALSEHVRGDPALGSFLHVASAQQWLTDHDARKQAVQFLRRTHREAPAAVGSWVVAITLVLVTVESADAAYPLLRTLRLLEDEFGSWHETFVVGDPKRDEPWLEVVDQLDRPILVVLLPDDRRTEVDVERELLRTRGRRPGTDPVQFEFVRLAQGDFARGEDELAMRLLDLHRGRMYGSWEDWRPGQ